MKWKAALAATGLTEETASHGIRKKIKQYATLENSVNMTREALKRKGLTEEEKAALQAREKSHQEALEIHDADLVKTIEKFHANKDRYTAMGDRLKQARGKKTSPAATPQAAPQPQPQATPAPTPEPQQAAQGAVIEATQEPKKEEKKDNTASWLLGALGIAAAIFFGGRFLKNK